MVVGANHHRMGAIDRAEHAVQSKLAMSFSSPAFPTGEEMWASGGPRWRRTGAYPTGRGGWVLLKSHRAEGAATPASSANCCEGAARYKQSRDNGDRRCKTQELGGQPSPYRAHT